MTGWPELSVGLNPNLIHPGVTDHEHRCAELRAEENENRDQQNDKDADEQFLLRAFHSFSAAAGSLERSYGLLRNEVERLRRELGSACEG